MSGCAKRKREESPERGQLQAKRQTHVHGCVKEAIKATANDRTSVVLELKVPNGSQITDYKLRYRTLHCPKDCPKYSPADCPKKCPPEPWEEITDVHKSNLIPGLCENKEYEFCLALKEAPTKHDTSAHVTLCLGCDVVRSQLDALIRIAEYTNKDAVENFFKYVNCLLNVKGGTVIIHSAGTELLDKFDQKVDKTLNDLISNGLMYHNVFERSFSDRCHLVYRVKPLLGLRPCSTLDFKSKMSQNKGIESPSYVNMEVFMRELCDGKLTPNNVCAGPSKITFEEGKQVYEYSSSWEKPLQESMTVQAKVVIDSHFPFSDKAKVKKLVDYCWSSLKLREYISSFAKIEDGGSVYFGVFEPKVVKPMWDDAEQHCKKLFTVQFTANGNNLKVWKDSSKQNPDVYYVSTEARKKEEPKGELRTKAISMSEECCKYFKECIFAKVSNEMVWTGWEKPTDPVNVYFHKVKQTGMHEGYVIEIRVNYYHGLCFSDKDGPEAFIPKDKNANKIIATTDLQLVPVKDWIQSFKSENWKSEPSLKRQDVQWQ